MRGLRSVLPVVLALPLQANAEGNCTTVDVDFLPAALRTAPVDHLGVPFPMLPPQIVAWIEKTDGTYVDTIYITQQTGTYGMGNRPGRFDFNSGPNWPYGRRITTFPIWAHRHGLSWPEIEFQDHDESDLSHQLKQSSPEPHYCRPLLDHGNDKPQWDAMTCASPIFTDKGVMPLAGAISLYPPRNDVAHVVHDDPGVDMYATMNPFDAVSAATPFAGQPAAITYAVPETVPFGDYVMFVEVSREFDPNDSYNDTQFPPPVLAEYSEYGMPYLGQPSIVYRVPFTIMANDASTAFATDYAGYGDPTGADGVLRAPDATITVDVPGSGADRLQLIAGDTQAYRIRVVSKPQIDSIAPAIVDQIRVTAVSQNEATIAFIAPGDDGTIGKAKKYDIRYHVGSTMTEAEFATATPIPATVIPDAAGTSQSFDLTGLMPETTYTIGIAATDDCRNTGPLAVLVFDTPERSSGQVDACFIATAAYGSVMADDVDMLRRFRDALLRRTVLGELAVETYYTFGPAVGNVVGESDLLRHTARDLLAPVVESVKQYRVRR